MRHHEDRFRGEVGVRPQLQDLVPQVLRRQRIEGRERLVHAEQERLDRERPRDPDALLHPAAEFARERVLEPGQPDGIDESPSPCLTVCHRHVLRLEPQLDILRHGEPREERE